MKYVIKPFNELTNDELYQLLKARVDVFVVEQACPYPDLDDFDQEALHYFLKDKDKLVALVRLLPSKSRYQEASIGRVLVTKKYRGNGYARDIMTKAMNYIQNEWGESQIKLQAQLYLENFYASLGFKRLTHEYVEDNIPHVDMIWERK